ncbi:hypothetical protein BGZ65_000520 [Modicella reniformis]|uniref:Uncharacterized protein n=1 Tax=Modicella reniformis TaxID=1440133 RepID=A0A9P6MA91_9FUNG|nr:hypothetical protein BGZ65_000520 [Modicella reniformis]
MRRTHPQRAKVPGMQQQHQSANHVPRVAQGNLSKQWTTVSDIRNNNDNNNRNRYSTNGGNSNTRTNESLPFSFQKSNLSQHSKQSFDNAYEELEDDISELLRGDSDDDFEAPDRSNNRSTRLASRRRRSSVEDGSGKVASPDEDKPVAKRQRGPSQPEDGCLLDESWPSSSDSLDFDFGFDTASSKDSNPITRIQKPALSTRSVISATQYALNEIDELLMGDSVPMSPVHDPESPAEVFDTVHRKPSEGAAVSRSGTPVEVPASALVREERTETDTHQDQGLKDNVHLETSKDAKTKDSEHKADPLPQEPGQDEIQDQAQPSLVFDLPATVPDFKSRLDELMVRFQSSLDNMIEAIQNVDSLRCFVKAAIIKHQEYLEERGKHIELQAQNLQMEATILHSKAEKGLD